MEWHPLSVDDSPPTTHQPVLRRQNEGGVRRFLTVGLHMSSAIGDRRESTSNLPARSSEPDRDQLEFDALARSVGRLVRWAEQRGLTRERFALAIGLLSAVAIALWLTSGAWGGRPPAGDDVTGHLRRADFATPNLIRLIRDGRVDGWDPSFILGFQAFLFLGPGLNWAIALVQALSFSLLSTTGALKVVVIASFVAVPVSVAFLARSFGLSKRAAGIAAVLALTVNSPFGGVGLYGLFVIGLVPHQFAAPFFFLALGGIVRLLREPTPTWIVFTALALAALLLSHGRSVIILAVCAAIIIAAMSVPRTSLARLLGLSALVRNEVGRQLELRGLTKVPGETPARSDARSDDVYEEHPSRQALVSVGGAVVGAVGLAALILVPLAAHRDLQGIVTDWGRVPLTERLRQIWRGETLFRPGVPIWLLVGFAFGVIRVARGRPLALPLVVTPIAFLIVGQVALDQWPNNVISQQLPSRGLGYAAAIAVLPLAALLAASTRSFGFGGDLLAIGAAAALVIIPLGPTRDTARQMPEPVPQMREAARQLGQLVPDGARFVTQRDFPGEIERTKVTHPDLWLAWASGRDTLNSFSPESSMNPAAAYESEHLLDRPPDTVADALSRLGVTHLVTVSDEAATTIAASPRFREAWRSSPLAIFSVTAPPGQPAPSSLLATEAPAQAALLQPEAERLVIEVNASAPTNATVAVGWSPKWHGRVNGGSVPLQKSPDGLLKLRIPEGTSRLTLEFRPDVWDRLGALLTVATLIIGGLWVRKQLREFRESYRLKQERGQSTTAPNDSRTPAVDPAGHASLASRRGPRSSAPEDGADERGTEDTRLAPRRNHIID